MKKNIVDSTQLNLLDSTTSNLFVISGATATGKSDFALQLADHLNGEIINADIGSWYTPLTIGTAKPDWRSLSIPHHLFDILDTPQRFSVVQFRERVVMLVQEIWARGKTPIVVGGSAFFIKALWYRQADIPDAKDIEQALHESTSTTQELWQELLRIDPIRAARLHEHDRYRIVRALAIHRVTGQVPSNFEPIFDPIAPMMGIICIRDRQELYDRINQRVLVMLQEGWISEVEQLVGTEWAEFLEHKKIIGYDDILHYLKTDRSFAHYQKLVTIIQQKTRNYAKRQNTFLGKLQKEVQGDLLKTDSVGFIDEMNLTLCDVGLYIKGLSNRFNGR